MSYSVGLAAWKLSFQLSPIILTNGIATNIPGGMLPIIAITEAVNFPLGLLTGGENIELDDFFANFQPLAGATLVDQQIGEYPFANQAVAANAVITQPLVISMQMIVPVRNPLGYEAKLATMMALKYVLDQHNSTGGTYIVATPSYIYTDCVMRRMSDASTGLTRQPQNIWQLDFEKPLLTLEQAQQAQNNLMSKITSGTPVNGQPTWSGLGPTVGQPPSLAGASVIPAQGGVAGSSIASSNQLPGPGLLGNSQVLQ